MPSKTSTTRKALEADLMKLPARSRARLAVRLIASLDGPGETKSTLWQSEAKRRSEELRTGKVKGLPANRVLEKARSLLK